MDFNLEQIFEKVKRHSDNSFHEWDLATFEKFIVSFEKNTQAANEKLAKNYGNIIKDLVSKIQMKDAILLQDDEREQEILEQILTDNPLKELFSKLYILIQRSNRTKKNDLNL